MGLITLLANLLRGSAGTPTVPISKPVSKTDLPLIHAPCTLPGTRKGDW